MVLVDAGKRRNGKPHRVLMIQTFICLREADAKAVAKATGLQFVKKTESEDGGR